MSSVFQRLLLAVAILEIPLQIDTYLFYQHDDAEVGAIGGLNIAVMTYALTALYLMWMVEAALRVEPRNRPIRWGLPLLVYLGVVAVSAAAADKPLLSVFELNLLGQAYLLFFYVANRIERRSDITFLIQVLGVAVAMQTLIILGTFWIEGPREISLGFIRTAIHEDGRPTGTLMSPTVTGSFLSLLIIPVASLLFTPVSKRMKAFSLLVVVLCALAIALTQTRGAILAMAIASMVFGTCLFVRGRLPKWAPAVAVGVAALMAVPVIHVFQTRIQEGDNGSAEARIHLSLIALEIIGEHPLVGVGAGNSHLAAATIANASPYRSEWFYTVHCKYLLVWSETGVLGLAAFLAFLISTLAQGWKTWRLSDPLLSTVALGLVAGIVGQMVHMSVDVFNARGQVQILWCCAAIIAGMTGLRKTAASETAPDISTPLPIITGHAA